MCVCERERVYVCVHLFGISRILELRLLLFTFWGELFMFYSHKHATHTDSLCLLSFIVMYFMYFALLLLRLLTHHFCPFHSVANARCKMLNTHVFINIYNTQSAIQTSLSQSTVNNFEMCGAMNTLEFHKTHKKI